MAPAPPTASAPSVQPLQQLGRRVRDAATRLRKCPPHLRHDALLVAADELEASAHEVLAANRRDLEGAERDGLGATAIDRLRLTEGRLGEMADSLRDVAGLPDPVGEVVDGWVRPNGLRVERIRVPLGVVGIIYENRPNVTSDAAARSACVRATPPFSGARPRRSSPTVRSSRSCDGRWPRSVCPRMRSSSSRTPGARRWSNSCVCAASSTAWCPAGSFPHPDPGGAGHRALRPGRRR